MKFIKEVTQTTYTIRTNTYTSTLEHFNRLFAEITQDFPDIRAHDVKVVQYGGQSYKRTFGLEFQNSGARPTDYIHIDKLEYTL